MTSQGQVFNLINTLTCLINTLTCLINTLTCLINTLTCLINTSTCTNKTASGFIVHSRASCDVHVWQTCHIRHTAYPNLIIFTLTITIQITFAQRVRETSLAVTTEPKPITIRHLKCSANLTNLPRWNSELYVYTLRGLNGPISYLGACYVHTKVTKCIREKMTLYFRGWTITSHSPGYEIGPINCNV